MKTPLPPSTTPSALPSSTTWWFLPPPPVTGKLFATGATIGPVVDSLHNQCLLQYQWVPINIDAPPAVSSSLFVNSGMYSDTPHLFASSWAVPPLLGVAYIVLGGILPRIFQAIVDKALPTQKQQRPPPPPPQVVVAAVASSDHRTGGEEEAEVVPELSTTTVEEVAPPKSPSLTVAAEQEQEQKLGWKAILAVLSTGAIIKLTEFLVLHANNPSDLNFNAAVFETSSTMEQQLLIALTAAVTQWAYLDGTLVSFIVGTLAAVLGPLSELPFIASGAWRYLPDATDYFPLNQGFLTESGIIGDSLRQMLGPDYANLGLSSITGPCYMAVTMDAIALGRWFDATSSATAEEDEQQQEMLLASSETPPLELVEDERAMTTTTEDDTADSSGTTSRP